MTEATKRSTIRDVAAAAGVSVASVSRVLSGKYAVGASTRSRVMKAVKDLDFVVNAHARALNQETPGTVAIVIRSVTTPFLAHVAQGVEQQAALDGQLCLVCTTQGDPDREVAAMNLMREQQARAVILVGGVLVTEEYTSRMIQLAHSLDAAGSRLVMCGRPAPAPDLPVTVVDYDNAGGAYAITSFLLSAGHRSILQIGGEEMNTTATVRVAGFRKALKDWSVPYDAGTMRVAGPMTRAFGYETMRARLAEGVRFTAVFAGNDDVAAGVLLACRHAGVRVPEELSVVGYDDEPIAADLVPALTTVRIPTDELGRAAVRRVLHPNAGIGDSGIIGTHVVVRDSVCPPRTEPELRARRGGSGAL
ncbi:LacI family transcriptional regulator [Longispora fulva]|uniref:LacI family transcriptional regulator n=1 Tax=Longispora fulva TaxID=619741 RepID=A0A8J7GFZ1_9ACTN|nr:LacI family DNA-binding transcriptional regulator [Longispora fulva]MBG6133844.1 LacI family transcriptional regulator [Longispora fulva]GIG62883.1 LacI family transcriptional regulator [Longispora fulva]